MSGFVTGGPVKGSLPGIVMVIRKQHGGSQSRLVSCTDGRLYVLKMHPNPQGRKRPGKRGPWIYLSPSDWDYPPRGGERSGLILGRSSSFRTWPWIRSHSSGNSPHVGSTLAQNIWEERAARSSISFRRPDCAKWRARFMLSASPSSTSGQLTRMHASVSSNAYQETGGTRPFLSITATSSVVRVGLTLPITREW